MRNPRMHRWSLTRQRVQHARMSTSPAIDLQALEALDEAGLRAQVQRLLGEVAQRDALPTTASFVTRGRQCPECGARALRRVDGCERCTECNHVGSCG